MKNNFIAGIFNVKMYKITRISNLKKKMKRLGVKW